MARPRKKGLDYFPLDCRLDEKFELIEAEFGLKGFAIVVKLLQKIYALDGYYCEWNEDISLLFARKNLSSGDGTNLIDTVVQASIRRGIFSKELYEKHGILTSSGIQKRYLEACVRREKVEMKKEYLLINVDKNQVNTYSNPINVDNNSKNVDHNPQSKVKKSKVKNTIKDITTGSPSDIAISEAQAIINPEISLTLNDGTQHHVYLTDIEEWKELYPAVDIMQELRKMKGWINSNPARRKTKRGIKRFINNWLAKEQDKGGTRQGFSQVQRQPTTNKFNNYPQRTYTSQDYAELEKKLTNRGLDSFED